MALVTPGGALVPSGGNPAMLQADPVGGVGVGALPELTLLDKQAAYGELYKAQPWVNALVLKLARATSRLPLQVFRRKDDGSRERDRDGGYAELLRRPNPRLGPKRLWLWTAGTKELYGEAMWLKLRDDRGRVRELHPLHPTGLDGPKLHPVTGQLCWVWRPRSWWIPFEDVVYFSDFNPGDLVRGLSPCEPLRQTLQDEHFARRGQAGMWRNGARPGVILTHPKTLSEGARARLEARFEQTQAGVENWGSTAVFEEGISATQLQVTPEDMQYVESRRLNREECCAVYDVPPPAVHILDHATFSNITENLRSMYRDTQAPRLNLYEDALATQLAPDFDPSGATYAEFLLDEVLRGAFETRSPANAQAIQTGQRTPNEVRRQDNLPDLPGGDELLVNAALLPLSAVLATVEAQQAAAVDAAAPPTVDGKGLTARDGRVLAGRMSRVEHVDDVDVDALVAGLDGDPTLVRSLVRAAQLRGDDVRRLRAYLASAVTDPLSLDPAPALLALEAAPDPQEVPA